MIDRRCQLSLVHPSSCLQEDRVSLFLSLRPRVKADIQTRSISPRYVGEADSSLENEIEIDPFMGIDISRNVRHTPHALTKYTWNHTKRCEQCIMLETL
jgi:hypothetical protein